MFREVYFSLKIFTNGLDLGLPLWAWDEKAVHEFSGKEKVLGVVVRKEGHVDTLQLISFEKVQL